MEVVFYKTYGPLKSQMITLVSNQENRTVFSQKNKRPAWQTVMIDAKLGFSNIYTLVKNKNKRNDSRH